MADAVQITDHEGRGVARLITRLQDKPKIAGMLSSWLEGVQDLEDAIFALRSMLLLSSARGVWLDYLGKLVGQSREGRTDAVYRVWIGARILVNRSSGTAPQIYAIVEAVLPEGTSVQVVDRYPAAFEVVAHDGVPHDTGVAVAALLQEAKCLGVGCQFVWQSAPVNGVFRLAAGASEETDVMHGFDRGRLADVRAKGIEPLWDGPPSLDGSLVAWWPFATYETDAVQGAPEVSEVGNFATFDAPLENTTGGNTPAAAAAGALTFGASDWLRASAQPFNPLGTSWLVMVNVRVAAIPGFLHTIWKAGQALSAVIANDGTIALGHSSGIYASSTAAITAGARTTIGWGVDVSTSELIYVVDGVIERVPAALLDAIENTQGFSMNQDAGGAFDAYDVAAYVRDSGGFSDVDVQSVIDWIDGHGVDGIVWPASTAFVYDYATRTVTGSDVDSLPVVAGTVPTPLSQTGAARPTYNAGPPERITFDGTADSMSAAVGSVYLPAGTTRADLFVIAKINALPAGSQRILGLHAAGAPYNTDCILYTQGSNLKGWVYADVGGTPTSILPTAAFTDTAAYHLFRLSFRPSGAYIYLDGSLHSQALVTNNGQRNNLALITAGANPGTPPYAAMDFRHASLLVGASDGEVASIEAQLLLEVP